MIGANNEVIGNNMKQLRITWKGITPLIMHSCQGVNPLFPLTIEKKKLTSKKKRTEEDEAQISNLEWLSGLYWRDEIGPYIPAENIEATIINGAKSFRKGSDVQKFCTVNDPWIPLDYGRKMTKDELMADYSYRDVRIMTVQRSKVNRTRPRFNRWEITFILTYDSSKIDFSTIEEAIKYAGSYVGLCDSRPKYGKFDSIIEELN